MINQIVIDPHRNLFNTLENIKEKLDYFRRLSKTGLTNLSEKEFGHLKLEINTFFNIQFAAFTKAKVPHLFRVSFNQNIKKERGRLNNISQLLGPPSAISTFNRCNLPGESIFYCALDINTILWETKPQAGDLITISEWKTKPSEEIVLHGIFNHPDIIKVNSAAKKIFEDYLKEMNKLHPNHGAMFDAILKFITEEFVKPIPKDKPKEYLFSALFSSGLFQKSPDNFQIQGIAYPSIQKDYGTTNIAILNSLVLDKLDIVAITAYDIIATDYNKTNTNSPISIIPWSVRMTDFDLINDKIIYPDTPEEFDSWIKRHIENEH